jgi:hypothetical protein
LLLGEHVQSYAGYQAVVLYSFSVACNNFLTQRRCGHYSPRKILRAFDAMLNNQWNGKVEILEVISCAIFRTLE